MIMKNFEVKELGDFLYKLSLKGKESRMRSRFVSMLEAHLAQVNAERQQLIDEFAKKDEKGEFLVEIEDGVETLVFENRREFNREMAILMNEDFIIEESKDKAEMIEAVKGILYTYGEATEMSGDSAMLFDRFCEILGI
ncbi:hypothetical protein ABE073_03775 [Lederbergia citrisecunda]|uniref:hypothetical protein n=1 Tax=Lederbergia citrisecunda TaxID=2833583 RepID=UPI003D29B2D7